MSIEANVDAVFGLFNAHGNNLYCGEHITQTSHMIQCAQNAEHDNQPPEVVLGALLHDIGNLVGHDSEAEKVIVNNVDIGPKDHDKMGEDFLMAKGFPIEVYCFARGHVDAIRYMAFNDPEYVKGLGWTSQQTLLRKGGPMNAEEAAKFEALPHYDAIIKCRKWDENAKVKDATTEPLEKYRQIAIDYLKSKQ